MYIKVPIIGTGTARDSYRPKFNGAYSAVIPCGSDGRPKSSECIIAMDDNASVPGDAVKLKDVDAVNSILSQNPGAKIDMCRTKGHNKSPLELSPLVGFLAASRSEVDRRWLMKAGLVAAGGYLFYNILRPRPAFALTRNTLDTDNFNRSNSSDIGTEWDQHTGEGWATGTLFDQWVQPLPEAPEAGIESFNATVAGADQWAFADLIRLSNAGGYVNAGVLCRQSAPGGSDNSYLGALQIGNLFIGKRIAGVFTSLTSVAETYVAGYAVALEVSGTGLECFYNNVSTLTTTDSDVASGRCGLNWYLQAGTSNGDVKIDNFSMGDFAGGATRPNLLQMLGVS